MHVWRLNRLDNFFLPIFTLRHIFIGLLWNTTLISRGIFNKFEPYISLKCFQKWRRPLLLTSVPWAAFCGWFSTLNMTTSIPLYFQSCLAFCLHFQHLCPFCKLKEYIWVHACIIFLFPQCLVNILFSLLLKTIFVAFDFKSSKVKVLLANLSVLLPLLTWNM